MKIVAWNADGVGSRGRELRALIAKTSPDVVVISELKAIAGDVVREAWMGAAVDVRQWKLPN